MKTCFKCGEQKPFIEFYKHKGMFDGHLNKCKECSKEDVKENRIKNSEYYREYDRARGSRQSREYAKEYRERYPNKYRCHKLVGNALRRGTLRKMPCSICGTTKNIVAHHEDYNYAFNVIWMCQSHHIKWHKKNGEGKNGV